MDKNVIRSIFKHSLEQDERSLLADPAAGLVALGDQDIDAGVATGKGLLRRGGNQPHAATTVAGESREHREPVGGARGQDHTIEGDGPAQDRPEPTVLGRPIQEDAEPPAAVLGQVVEGRDRGAEIVGELKVHDAERTGPAARDRQRRVGSPGRRQDHEVEARSISHGDLLLSSFAADRSGRTTTAPANTAVFASLSICLYTDRVNGPAGLLRAHRLYNDGPRAGHCSVASRVGGIAAPQSASGGVGDSGVLSDTREDRAGCDVQSVGDSVRLVSRLFEE